jgi:hypothetical protein
MRAALFHTAAYYALTDEETKEIMDHESIADFYFFQTKSAKQLVTAGVCICNRGQVALWRRPIWQESASKTVTRYISVHYAETVFSNPFFSMQCIWAWNPRQPSWIARIGEGQGLPLADM